MRGQLVGRLATICGTCACAVVNMTQVFFLLVPIARGCMIFAEVVNTNLYVQDSYRSPVGVARIFPENQN